MLKNYFIFDHHIHLLSSWTLPLPIGCVLEQGKQLVIVRFHPQHDRFTRFYGNSRVREHRAQVPQPIKLQHRSITSSLLRYLKSQDITKIVNSSGFVGLFIDLFSMNFNSNKTNKVTDSAAMIDRFSCYNSASMLRYRRTCSPAGTAARGLRRSCGGSFRPCRVCRRNSRKSVGRYTET